MQTRLSRAINAAAYGMMAWVYGSLGSVALVGSLGVALESRDPRGFALAGLPLGIAACAIGLFALGSMRREIERPFI